ncbi:MAG: hypothetical protein HWE25_05085 [Alphaproteobacteria bacterium]|nr:hypothetical protein [Alphaproteobacteria bacterium]
MPEILKGARAQFDADMKREETAPIRLVQSRNAVPEFDEEPIRRSVNHNKTPAAARSNDPVVQHAPAASVAGASQPTVRKGYAEERRLRVQAASQARRKAAKPSSARNSENCEVRRCFSCGSSMSATRYRRSLLRFVRVYRCSNCRRHFEQDARGFQGFYVGLVVTLGAPFIYACLAKPQISYLEIGAVALVMFLLLWPVYVNVGHYLKAPVIMRRVASPLLPVSSGRTYWGRTLGGESRLFGAVFGVGFGMFAYFSLMIAALALAL